MRYRFILFTSLIFSLVISGCSQPRYEYASSTTVSIIEEFSFMQNEISDYSFREVDNEGNVIQVQYKKPYRYKIEHSNRQGIVQRIEYTSDYDYYEYRPGDNTVFMLSFRNTSACFPFVVDHQKLSNEILSGRGTNITSVKGILDGLPCYIVDATVHRNNYDGVRFFPRVRVWIDADTFMVVKFVGYTAEGSIWKEFSVQDIRINRGIPYEVFDFTPSDDMRIMRLGPCPVDIFPDA